VPRKKVNPRVKRPNADADLNPISVWKIATDTSTYGLSIFQHGTKSFIDTGRAFSGKQIDEIRAFVKKQKRKLSLDEDWKPFLRSMGKSI
jgi:hypothetical protein